MSSISDPSLEDGFLLGLRGRNGSRGPSNCESITAQFQDEKHASILSLARIKRILSNTLRNISVWRNVLLYWRFHEFNFQVRKSFMKVIVDIRSSYFKKVFQKIMIFSFSCQKCTSHKHEPWIHGGVISHIVVHYWGVRRKKQKKERTLIG